MFILDGKVVRDIIAGNLRERINRFGAKPVLAIIQVGEREDSAMYIKAKKHFAEKIGAQVLHIQFPDEVSDDLLVKKIEELNSDEDTHGIIVQMPLPKHLNEGRIIDVVDYKKDVDGLTSINLKLLLENKREGFVPATARGIIALLDHYKVPIERKQVLVIGRSPFVGKPIALSLLNRNATVMIAHSHTAGLPDLAKDADILIVAVGKAHLIGKDYVRPGHIVIDVGISTEAKLPKGDLKPENEVPTRDIFGDVDFEAVKNIVTAISPVPGGVGPMTVASLFQNLVEAFEIKQTS